MHFFLSCSWFFLKFWSSKMVLRKKRNLHDIQEKNVDATSPKHAPLLAFSENPAPDSYF